jgi:hypothetical protein
VSWSSEKFWAISSRAVFRLAAAKMRRGSAAVDAVAKPEVNAATNSAIRLHFLNCRDFMRHFRG